MRKVWDMSESDDDLPLTFCDQCGHLQLGLRVLCENCGVHLDRSVYDPFVAIHQQAAIVRQAVRGRAKPSTFGKLAVVLLGLIYLASSILYMPYVLAPRYTLLSAFMILLDLMIVALVFAALRRMLQRDSWSEYLRWE
jgi:hypothetical protein